MPPDQNSLIQKDQKEANRKFVSLITHQLRSPITAIKWCAETLSLEKTGPLNEKQREYIEEIKKLNDKNARLVNAVSLISKIENMVLEIEVTEFSIPETIKAELGKFNKKIEEKGLSVLENLNIAQEKLWFDQTLFKNIIIPLLSNAIIYANPKTQILINLKEDNDYITLSFENEGEKISASDQDKVFEKLFRSAQASRAHPHGNGLELYLAKMIVEITSGKIWFESNEKKTTFYVSIPKAGMLKNKDKKYLSEILQ